MKRGKWLKFKQYLNCVDIPSFKIICQVISSIQRGPGTAKIHYVNEYNEAVLLKQLYLSDKYYTFPAGYMQSGETAEEAIKREIKEEIGLEVVALKYVQSIWFHTKDILMLGYIARVKKQKLILSSEVDEAKWVKADDVVRLIYPEHPENIAFILYQHYISHPG